jgi:DNA (cytosine-5)-methyltransferase 1
MDSSFRFCDLFSGLGGFHLAARSLGGRCVFSSEINPLLRQLYLRNFNVLPEGDIRNVDVTSIPKHDLLCAGFPCQPFSKAGSQLGWMDSVRGTLFENILAIVATHRPEFLILENVAHFVRHDEGNTYLKVKTGLESLGYAVESRQLSPHQFGVPHIRERMYMVGKLGGLRGFQWPDPSHTADQLSIKSVLDVAPQDAVQISDQVERCLNVWQAFLRLFPNSVKLPSFPIWSMEFGATYPYHRKNLMWLSKQELKKFRGSHGKRLKGETRKEIEALLPGHARGPEHVFPHWKKLFIRQNREFYNEYKARIDRWLPRILDFPPSLQKLEWNCQGELRDIWKYVIQFRASGVRVKRATTSPSLVAMTSTQIPIIGWEKRYMTARECSRLQSMQELEHLPEGSVAAVEAFGNAVNVSVVNAILSRLLQVGPGQESVEKVDLSNISSNIPMTSVAF